MRGAHAASRRVKFVRVGRVPVRPDRKHTGSDPHPRLRQGPAVVDVERHFHPVPVDGDRPPHPRPLCAAHRTTWHPRAGPWTQYPSAPALVHPSTPESSRQQFFIPLKHVRVLCPWPSPSHTQAALVVGMGVGRGGRRLLVPPSRTPRRTSRSTATLKLVATES